MEEEEGSSVRLVRCPKCENLLTELPEYSVYQCGGCGAVLRGNFYKSFTFTVLPHLCEIRLVFVCLWMHVSEFDF